LRSYLSARPVCENERSQPANFLGGCELARVGAVFDPLVNFTFEMANGAALAVRV